MPTLVDIAGAGSFLPEKLDGRSVWPVLLGQVEHLEPRPMYWETYRSGGFTQVVRLGAWKMMRSSSLERMYEVPEGSPPARLELYNLETDPGERVNLAKDHPDICRKLTGIMNDTYTPHPEFPLRASEKPVFEVRTWEDTPKVFSP